MIGVSMHAQETAQSRETPRPLITQAVDESRLTTLKGNTHPLARPEFDLGTAPASLPMQRMLLVLKRGPDQETALRKLLDDQQDNASASYHQWLTPEQYGQQFGPTDSDLQTITAWLQSHGFQAGSTKGRTVLEFSGTAGQVQEAFHTTMHKYIVNGEQHWANASDPQIPTALTGAVAGVDSLHDFRKKAMNTYVGKYSETTKQLTDRNPQFDYNCQGYQCYGVSPYDFATIYDVLPLWNSGINGTGQTIAIVGRTNINPLDATDFWTLFGLTVPANKLNIILNGVDPGINGDEPEADIDVQWSGAVAPQAAIDFVTSASTETTDGVDLSAVYIVDNNLAPVMSESYGECELGLGTAGNQFYSSLWEQAAAQGISVFASSGDNGSAGCDNPGGPAQYGLNVNGIASTAFNAAVGGTDFNQYNTLTNYWKSTNDPTTQESAIGYIPETTWNDTCTNGIWITLGWGSTAEQVCNGSLGDTLSEAGSGGPSTCVINTQGVVGSCTQAYAKPSWQSGAGVPNDHVRDVPDISLFASNGFMGSLYVICQQDQTGSVCNLNSLLGYGGTSVASPAFAGIMSLVNQKMGIPQGVPGFALYKLVTKQANAFHDVPSGSTIATICYAGTPNCTVSVTGDYYGVLSGYSTGPGYDLATGLGSVDADNLVSNWTKATFTATTTALQLNSGNAVNVTHGTAVPVNIGVTSASATGQASLLVSTGVGTTTGHAIDTFTLSGGSTAGATTSMLPGGTYSVIAHYAGDGNYGGSYSSPVSVTVSKENSQPQTFLVTFDSSGHVVNPDTTTAQYGSPYALRVNMENSAGQICKPVGPGATACPSGTVMLTNNGTTLDAGTYTLNSYGYTEDLAVQLPGGTNSVKASYAGDHSFNPSSATNTLTITPAGTTTAQPSLYGATVGQSVNISTTVNTTSSGAAPSGTVTFYADGTALTGTTSYVLSNGSPGYSAFAQASFTSNANAFPSAGTYSITATYNGDANYSTSTSAATTVTVLYATPNVIVTPAQQTISYGAIAAISALVDTTNKTSHPTGTVTFVDAYTGATVSGPTTCTSATDTSGNFACQAVGTFTVTSGDSINVLYSGDANYPQSTSSAYINMPDFMISPQGGVSVTAGQSQSLTIALQASNGFGGAVGNFACSGLPAEATCTFSPTQVTIGSSGSASTTLTVTTAAIGQLRRRISSDHRATSGGTTEAFLLLVGACLVGIPISRRRRGMATILVLLAGLITLPSCGGGGGGGGGTSNPIPSISSLSPTQVAAGSQIQSLYINGSNFLSSSTVTYNGTLHNSSLQSPTQIQIALGPGDVGTTGQYPVVVTNPSPGGGSSAPLNFAVVSGTPTGVFSVTLTASSGPITHSTTLSMTVQ
ncbi:MAG TPA: Ig-like domain repeat protein [Candidatus Sulfotelmatobacter sp.]